MARTGPSHKPPSTCRNRRGCRRLERGDHDRVDSEFREAWGILDALGAEERLSRCHVAYAELLEKRGDLAAANRQLRLALNRLHPAKIAPPAPQLEQTATA